MATAIASQRLPGGAAGPQPTSHDVESSTIGGLTMKSLDWRLMKTKLIFFIVFESSSLKKTKVYLLHKAHLTLLYL